MKKTRKKILGFSGLVLVVAVTVFAALLPVPETQATTQVTDIIKVRVVGTVPAISIGGIVSGSTITSAEQTLTISYENVETLDIPGMKFTNADGEVESFDFLNIFPNYAPGELVININFLTGEYTYTYDYYDDDGVAHVASGQGQLPYYGYGDYIIPVVGNGFGGEVADGAVSFSYVPVDVDVSGNEDTGDVTIGLTYDADDGTETSTGQVDKITVNIYDESGKLVAGSPITVVPPTTKIVIPFADYGLPSGTYKIEVIAYDKNGEMLYRPFVKMFDYYIKPVPVPDTGGVLGNLNISKTDYLITGLLIFSLVGISGAIFIAKRGKTTNRRRK